MICSITIPLLESEAVILSIDVLTCTVSFSDVTKWNWLPVCHSNQTLSSLGITGQNSNELKCITHNYFNLLKRHKNRKEGQLLYDVLTFHKVSLALPIATQTSCYLILMYIWQTWPSPCTLQSMTLYSWLPLSELWSL